MINGDDDSNLFHESSWEDTFPSPTMMATARRPRPPRRQRPGRRHRRWHGDRDDGLPASAARAALRAVEAWDRVVLLGFSNKDLTRPGDLGWFELVQKVV